ncbi:hypothetical protein ACETIH_02655 [Microvirga arabica]|uniref:Uncharacterized protein n=1 Tax=Microvirga arabica TaxID=1128671 RepID=A0ABV6Y2X7_9HYPH
MSIMSTSRKTAANRANARRSTGPRTAAGREQSRRNAFKHGLAVSIDTIPELAHELAHLAQLIAGDDCENPLVMQAAALVAEAAIDLIRVRRAKIDLLTAQLYQSCGVPHPSTETVLPVTCASKTLECFAWEQLKRLDRYERRALSRRRTAIRAFEDVRAAAETIFSEEPGLHYFLPPFGHS